MGQFLMFVSVMVVATSATRNAVHIVPAAIIDTVDHPRYAFHYAISDPITRDNKAQWETRDGDVVKGSYSIAEPDGSLRVVDYRADDHTGFNAVVKKLGPSVHATPLVAPIVNPIVVPMVPLKPNRPTITSIHPIPLLARTAPQVTPLAGPLSYGFGGAPIGTGMGKVPSRGRWSLPWDPITRSYGGWRPLSSHSPRRDPKPYVNIYRSEYMDDGSIHKLNVGPIPFGKTLIIKKIH